MNDYFEIDFLDVESDKSGDAITIRYALNSKIYIHVVDGGFQATGEKVVDHIKQYYNNPTRIDHVVATHPDGDHAGGLRTVLESFTIGTLWMLRPWLYARELIGRFANYSSVAHLEGRLRSIYPNITALETIAVQRGIEIRDPFQGQNIGAFTVLAPTKNRYLDLIVESERTPEEAPEERQRIGEEVTEFLRRTAGKAIALIKSLWGVEVFSTDETSAENEMSVVQYARLCDKRILLTADSGRRGLMDAADFAPSVGLILPGIDRIQVPHHGSRRNVSTEVLDRWLGPRLPSRIETNCIAIVSSAKKDEHHPRKAVVRGFIHRGAQVLATESVSICTSTNAPNRGWGPATALAYPEDQEQ